ncbi:hypothetical protein RB595_010021 [Gaeumannomyces hyphopodioides]
MLSRLLLTRLPYLAGFGAAAPMAVPGLSPPLPAHQLSARDAGPYNSSLPNITIFATGGTIAGSAASNTQTTGYQAGVLGVDVLISAVPELRSVSNVRGVQVANVGSPSITPEILLNLTRLVQAALDDPRCQGAVVTHGTDTLEETAFFLDLTVRSEKPVVVVGAMRPATAVSADGPMNLLEAVSLAASPAARGRGAMVVLNDRIGSAFYVTKTHANALDTFAAREQGHLGFFIDAKPIFYYAPALPVGRANFEVLSLRTLPQVDVLFGHQGLTPALARAAVDAGAKGLVLAGMGAGSWTPGGTAVLAELVRDKGTQVVASSRVMGGFVRRAGAGNVYGAQNLNPQKARIMLQLALGVGYSSEQLATLFAFSS